MSPRGLRKKAGIHERSVGDKNHDDSARTGAITGNRRQAEGGGMAGTTISVLNPSTVMKDSEVEALLPALQTQLDRDFLAAWNIPAELVFVPHGQTPDPDSWWLSILDNSDQAGALGYHDVTNEGLPLGKVFAGT